MVTIEERVSNLETEFRTELRHLTTKADLNELRTEFMSGQGELRTEMKAGNAELRTEVMAEIGTLRTEVMAEISDLRTGQADLRTEFRTGQADLRTELKAEIQASQNRLIITMIGLMATGLIAVAGIMRFLA